MRNCLGCWTVRRLSLIGKITVLMSLVASVQVIHLLSPPQINSQIIKQINDLFFYFLWNSKGDKIKRNTIIQNNGNGGIRMIDIVSFNKALKSVWIRKYLDESNKGKWKVFFDAELFWKHLVAFLKDRNFLSDDYLLNNLVVLGLKPDTSKNKATINLFCYLRDSTFSFAEAKEICQLFKILSLF